MAGLFFYFQKLTYAIMLGHMQKNNHFWAQIKKKKKGQFLPRALQLSLLILWSELSINWERHFPQCDGMVFTSPGYKPFFLLIEITSLLIVLLNNSNFKHIDLTCSVVFFLTFFQDKGSFWQVHFFSNILQDLITLLLR